MQGWASLALWIARQKHGMKLVWKSGQWFQVFERKILSMLRGRDMSLCQYARERQTVPVNPRQPILIY